VIRSATEAACMILRIDDVVSSKGMAAGPPGGEPYGPGKTIYFSSTFGTITPATDKTDANGDAHTELTAAAHGFTVVMAQWLER